MVSSASRATPPLPPSRRAISGSSDSPRSTSRSFGTITIRCSTRTGLATA